MKEHTHLRIDSEDIIPNDSVEQNDITEVLAALQSLAEHTHHPVVRACLEQAYDDIVHLTTCGDESQVDDERAAA